MDTTSNSGLPHHVVLGATKDQDLATSKIEGTKKIFSVAILPYPLGAKFDPRNQAWAFQAASGDGSKNNSE